jgi:hypothetical protein
VGSPHAEREGYIPARRNSEPTQEDAPSRTSQALRQDLEKEGRRQAGLGTEEPKPTQPAPYLDKPRRRWRWLWVVGGLGVVLAIFLVEHFDLWPGIPASQWLPFAPKDGGFRVHMPGKPSSRPLPEPGAEGHLFVVERWDEQRIFVVGYKELPGNANPALLPAAFQKARDDMLAGDAGMRLLAEKPVHVDNHPGMEYHFDNSNKGVAIVIRMYFAGDRFFHLSVAGSRVRPSSSDVRKFFDSFQLRKR